MHTQLCFWAHYWLKRRMNRRPSMEEPKRKRTHPIENHETAAWAGIEERKPISKVTLPGEDRVEDAKDHVDRNEK